MTSAKPALHGAIGTSVAIAATKLLVAGITGSSAMLSEGIHSSVDTFNGVLLLVGIRLGRRPATPDHPFGHGKELCFWSLIVAVIIFGLGGGVSFYEGVQHSRHRQALHDPTWTFVVLGAAALFEGISVTIALRQFLKQAGSTPCWEARDRSKDPSPYTVLAEDAAALLGLLIAAAGIWSGRRFDMPVLDGAASLRIGVLLAAVATLLAWQSRGLLIGEGIRPETARAIRGTAVSVPRVRDVERILSMDVGPGDTLVTMDLEFDEGTAAADAAIAIADGERQGCSSNPARCHCSIAGPGRMRFARLSKRRSRPRNGSTLQVIEPSIRRRIPAKGLQHDLQIQVQDHGRHPDGGSGR